MFRILYNTVKHSSDRCCCAEDKICQQTNTEDINIGLVDVMNDQSPQARDITIEQHCYNSQVESTSSELLKSQNNTIKHFNHTCSSDDSICPHTSKEDITTGRADHFNDEQPERRDVTMEQCSCAS